MSRVLIEPGGLAWHISEEAHLDLAPDREAMGEQAYAEERKAIQEFLCGYFNSVGSCDKKMNKSISPMGTNGDGGKVLKVRWGRRGQGKSGGWRCVFVVYCDRRKVVLCRALLRDGDPTKADVAEASALAAAKYSGRP